MSELAENFISKEILTSDMLKTVKVTDKGQISIPQAIRDSLNIHKGDELIIINTADRIILEKSSKVEKEISDDLEVFRLASAESLRELWDNESDERWNEYLKEDY
jgi:AbrB family looped-hinge helix DNA binding protein